MQKIALPLRSTLVAVAVFGCAAVADQASAECEEGQEAVAGKAVAAAAAVKVAPAVAVTGKQMIDIAECNVGAGGILVSFKYNFLAADGLYWVQGSAKVKGSDVTEFKVAQMSPNLSAASSAKGIKLAAN